MWEIEVKKPDRLDRALREADKIGCEWLSRQAWERLLLEGRVSVNGRKSSKSGQSVSVGDRIVVDLPGEALGLLPATEGAPLLWQAPDRSFAVFGKASGISTIPIYPWDDSAFANRVAAFLESENWMSADQFSALASAPSLEGGVLQRLDRDTSGIICVALTPERKSSFRNLFSRGEIEKSYFAIVSGDIKKIEGKQRVWFGESSGKKVKASSQPLKGEATEVSLVVELCEVAGGRALIKVLTRQGNRHVVRAGMAALGAPLVGDSLYGGELDLSTYQLHAAQLKILDPKAFPGFPFLEMPPPTSFLDSLAVLGLHWNG